MEDNNEIFLNQRNEHNLYKYSDVDLVAYIKEINAKNNSQTDPQTKKNNQFLEEIARFLQGKLKDNIALHQKGFQIYKQKLLADKSFIQNSLKKELRDLTINELIEKLTAIKNNSFPKKTYFNIGQNLNNISNKNNNNQNSNPSLNNILFKLNMHNNNNINNNNNPFSFNNFINLNNNQNNEKNINNYENEKNNKNSKNKFIHGLDVKEVYHSPSPLISHKIPSNIIKENENINNKINFDEDQKIVDN